MAKDTKAIRDRRDFELKIQELTEMIRERAVVFPNDTPEKQVARVKQARKDPLFFATTYFPHYITSDFAEFHETEMSKIAAKLDSDESSIIAEIWSRGFGKTSLLAIILPIWAAVTKKTWFVIYVGADRELSKERTVAARLEFQMNARLRGDFPDQAIDEGVGEEYDFKTGANIRFRAQGYKQGIRGKVNGPHRPRLIVVDDLESHKDLNPKISRQKYDYVVQEAFGAFGDKGGTLIWLGNLTHSQSALAAFVAKCDEEPESSYFGYRIVKSEDEAGKSMWAAAYPERKLQAIRAVVGTEGYKRHYLMKPGIDGEVFREEWLRFWNVWQQTGGAPRPTEIDLNTKRLSGFTGIGMPVMPSMAELMGGVKVTYCDPSLGGGESNDYKAVLTVAFWNGWYWIVDAWVRRATILDMLEYMYSLDRRFPGSRMYMEKNFWQRLIWEYLPQLAVKMGYMLPISGVENRLKKEERILKLQPLYEWGHIWHCIAGKDWETFKEQLLGFPNAGNDDAPDALSGAIERFAEIQHANVYETLEKGGGSYVGMF